MPDAGQSRSELSAAELRDLIWSAHSGEIDDAGVARLEVLLQSSEAARRYYLEYTRLLADVQAGECPQGDLRRDLGQSESFETVRPTIPVQPVQLPFMAVTPPLSVPVHTSVRAGTSTFCSVIWMGDSGVVVSPAAL